jgi:hypothetical protein
MRENHFRRLEDHKPETVKNLKTKCSISANKKVSGSRINFLP